MLTANERSMIKEYIDSENYSETALSKYLSSHTIIGPEVFSACRKESVKEKDQRFDLAEGYTPVKKEVFIRRLPFYFFRNKDYSSFGEISHLFASIHLTELKATDPQEATETLEKLYSELEYLFYDKKFDLLEIFSYIPSQYGVVTGPFLSWAHYVHLCDQLGWNDYFPESFISSYNFALEACGLEPVIYKIDPILAYSSEPFYRDHREFTFEGTFPVDKDGRPVIRWTNLHIENAADISCNTENSRSGSLFVKISPDTKIFVSGLFSDDDDEYIVYLGPKHISFDGSALKRMRKAAGFTQQEVADAIGASVRTYQKWESGCTTPDSRYMLRLLNWLDISDPVLLASF